MTTTASNALKTVLTVAMSRFLKIAVFQSGGVTHQFPNFIQVVLKTHPVQ